MKKTIFFKKLPSLIGGLILILTTVGASTAQATVYYVAPNGDDSSKTGAEVAPFQTIKHGVSVLSAGDTLFVKAGTYNESIHSRDTFIPNGTSWDNPVTVKAKPGTVTIKPPSAAFFWIMDGQDKYLIIDGFIIDGQNQALHGFKFMRGTTHVRVKNSEIKNSTSTAILITGTGKETYGPPNDTYHELMNLNVHHNGSNWGDHGIYIETGRNLVEHCDLHHNSNYGGKFFMGMQFGGGGTANYNIYRYNTTHDNGQNTTILSYGWLLGSGIGNEAYGNIAYNEEIGFGIGADATDNLLYNNIAYNNEYYGVLVFGSAGGSEHTMVYNNTVYDNPLYGIVARWGANNTEIKNNIAYNNGKNSASNIWLEPSKSPGTVVENNIITNPKFVDPLKHDFKLQSDSPAIDSGVNIPEVKVDFFGVPRYQGKSYDIGAIEQVLTDDFTPPATPTRLRILTSGF